jgi:hypothetical protein
MAFPDYTKDLLAGDFEPSLVLHRYFHSGQSVAFHGAPPEEEPNFKIRLCNHIQSSLGIQLHPLQLVLCGSAHLGFSPVPTDEKFGKPFDSRQSDMDVAIISVELFDRWWAELQSSDLFPPDRAKVADDLFWGLINPANVYRISEIGKKWWKVFGNFPTERARSVRGRVYRNFWSMQAYHRRAIDGGRKRLLNVRW